MPSHREPAQMRPLAEAEAALNPVPHLRFLKWVVGGLAVVMALGIAAIVALLWWRLTPAPVPRLPDNLSLPAGAQPAAVTVARDWTVVLTEAGEVLVFDRDGQLRQQVPLPAR